MVSIRLKFKASKSVPGEGVIYYQIMQNRRVCRIASDYRILASEWDEKRAVVATDAVDRRIFIRMVKHGIDRDMKRVLRVVRRFEESYVEFSVNDIAEEYRRLSSQYSVFSYMETLAVRFGAQGRRRTAETYRSTLCSFKRYRKGCDIAMDALTSAIVEDYEYYLRGNGLTQNTSSFYIRILRAAYNRASEEEGFERENPFCRVYTGVDKTVKRAIQLNAVRAIKLMDLSANPTLDYARDMFMMSFYLRGMSFVDMAFLRKSDLHMGHVVYWRRKTGQRLVIEWTAQMQEILEKYDENESDFLLPIITGKVADNLTNYRNQAGRINKGLKAIAKKAFIAAPLTMYVARHSWATIAKSQGVPIGVISEGLGHDSERTTMIYLAALESSAIDKANRKIIKALE